MVAIALATGDCYSSIATVTVCCKFAMEEAMPKKGWFDAEAFYGALDLSRESRKLTWKRVAEQSGVSASTLTRMGQGKRPDVDSLAALAAWSGLDADDFVRTEEESEAPEEPLARISTYLRSDRNLSPESARALEEIIKVAYDRLRKV